MGVVRGAAGGGEEHEEPHLETTGGRIRGNSSTERTGVHRVVGERRGPGNLHRRTVGGGSHLCGAGPVLTRPIGDRRVHRCQVVPGKTLVQGGPQSSGSLGQAPEDTGRLNFHPYVQTRRIPVLRPSGDLPPEPGVGTETVRNGNLALGITPDLSVQRGVGITRAKPSVPVVDQERARTRIGYGRFVGLPV